MHTFPVWPTGIYQVTRALTEGDPCRLTRLRRILPFMSDAVARLNAALEGRYAIERELGEGVIGEGRHPIRLRTGVRPTDREPNYEN